MSDDILVLAKAAMGAFTEMSLEFLESDANNGRGAYILSAEHLRAVSTLTAASVSHLLSGVRDRGHKIQV